MVSERQLQFRVGLMVLAALAVGTGLFIRTGQWQKQWQGRYQVFVKLDSASGLYPSAPVLLHGMTVGSVREIKLDDQQRGVVATLEIDPQFHMSSDTRAAVSRSLLGETIVDLIPGKQGDKIKPGTVVAGESATDPMEIVNRLERKTSETMASFEATSREWQQVARHINSLMETKRGTLDQVIEQAAGSLAEFSMAMQATNQLVREAQKVMSDPKTQQALRETVQSLPQVTRETKETLVAARSAIETMDRNLQNLESMTSPLAKRSDVMVARLDSSLTNLDKLLVELTRFSRALNQPDGTLQKFVSDPALYDHLDRTVQMSAILLRNLEPVIADMREFSDKIARRPELLGVGGAMQPSSGLRDNEVIQQSSAQEKPPGRQAPPAPRR